MLRNVRWLDRAAPQAPRRSDPHRCCRLVDGLRRAGLSVVLTTEGHLAAVDQPTGQAAYRIVQEALTNTLRHSGAATVAVDVSVGPGLDIEVTDDGVGTPEWAEGNGVRGMRERAGAVAGPLTRDSGTARRSSCSLTRRPARTRRRSRQSEPAVTPSVQRRRRQDAVRHAFRGRCAGR